jgi:hypothetical protein
MLIENGSDVLELRVHEQIPFGTQCSGDTQFRILAQIGSANATFSADCSAWVSAPNLITFLEQLRLLEETRKGAAVLESMSPGELRLEIRPHDCAGHMAASGQVGQWVYNRTGERHWSVVAFGISFCPSELPRLLQEFRNIVEMRSLALEDPPLPRS